MRTGSRTPSDHPDSCPCLLHELPHQFFPSSPNFFVLLTKLDHFFLYCFKRNRGLEYESFGKEHSCCIYFLLFIFQAGCASSRHEAGLEMPTQMLDLPPTNTHGVTQLLRDTWDVTHLLAPMQPWWPARLGRARWSSWSPRCTRSGLAAGMYRWASPKGTAHCCSHLLHGSEQGRLWLSWHGKCLWKDAFL